jgi:hypothetical protein
VGLARDAGWTSLERVSPVGGTRLDSLHQLSADGGLAHLVYPRIGPRDLDDRVLYQRTDDRGATWSSPRVLFSSTQARRVVVPNLAISALDRIVAVAWRARGPSGTSLYVRVSTNAGRTFGRRTLIDTTSAGDGIGVPAVTVGSRRVITVAWTDREDGRVRVRHSRNAGRSFRDPITLGRSGLSIDCEQLVRDALVGVAASRERIHVAWSEAPRGECQADRIVTRSTANGGRSWGRMRTVTRRRSYGWPELDARGSTVLVTVQWPGGGYIVGRSPDHGRTWKDQLVKARRGRNYSAADVVLLPRRRAMIVFVNEKVSRSRLISTKVVSRASRDNGATFRAAVTVAPSAFRLRMAPNVVAPRGRPMVVLQAGAFSGTPRNVFSSRLR